MMGFMEVRLLVAHRSAETKQIRLGAETLIGRGPDCKLRISSGQVSRRHCLIKVDESSVSIRDLGSANGTRLNGETIAAETDVPILNGSTLAVGPLKFVVQFAAPKTTADEDTEWLSGLAVAAKSSSQENQTKSAAPAADGEETKDYPPAMKLRRDALPQVVVAPEGSSLTAGPSPVLEADAGRVTEHDISIDPSETIFDVSLEEPADPSNPGAFKLGPRTDSEKAAETHLLFEEDDLQRLAAEVESAATANSSTGSQGSAADSDSTDDARAGGQPAKGGLLGFLRGKKKPEKSGPATSPSPDDNDDQLRKFLSDG
jgi:pSer/pThr/pTyr-binding forkhead associated (FHA) protein